MGSNLKNFIERGLKRIESDLDNQVITWKGEDYVCAPATDNETMDLEAGGFSTNGAMIITVRKSVFTDGIYPEEEDNLTYNSTIFKINKVTNDPWGMFITLYINQK